MSGEDTREALVEALRVARRWIYEGEAQIGWDLDRLDAVIAREAASRLAAPVGELTRPVRDVVCSKCGFPIRDSFCGLSCDGKADGVPVAIQPAATPPPAEAREEESADSGEIFRQREAISALRAGSAGGRRRGVSDEISGF